MGFLLHLLAIYLGGAPLYAQTVGAASTQLLSRGPGAESAALAGATVSTVHDPTALYWNPAGLAAAGGMASGEHLFLFGGARYDFIGLSVPSAVGTFGLGALQLDRDGIVARQAIDDPGTSFSNTQSVYMLGLGRPLSEHWSAGATANVLDFNVAGYKDKGWGLDAGAQGSYPQEEFWGLKRLVWSFGAAVKNLVEPRIALMSDTEAFPRELRGGAGLSFQTASRVSPSGVISHDRAMILLSERKVAGDPTFYPGLALAYDFQNVLVFRLGYDGNLSAGMGFHTPDGKFILDYSMENKPLSLDHRFTISYRFLAPKTKPQETFREELDPEYAQAKAQAEALAEENFASGENSFRNQDYQNARESLRLAALLMPGDREKAQAFQRAQEACRRDQIRRLTTDATLNPHAGEEEKAYLDIAQLLDLQADNRAELAALSSRLVPRMPDYLTQKEFDAHAQAARGLLALGHVDEARALADTLDVIKSSATAVALEALKEEIAIKDAAVRSAFKEVATPAERLNVSAVNAALALRRAFLDDPQAQKEAQEALDRYRAENPLSIKERFYVLKLYYLAAAHYARKAAADARSAADLLAEVLRRDPTNSDADTLLDTMAREGLVPR